MVDPVALAAWVGAAGSAVLAGTDIVSRRIPNRIVYPLLLTVPVFLIWRCVDVGSLAPAMDVCLGVLLIGGTWLGIFLLGGCGGGDVKLMAANAGLLGLTLGLFHLVFALMAGVAYLLVLLLVRLLAAVLPTPALLSRFVASHRIPVPQSVGAEAPATSGKRMTLAIPFALPVALGYIPVLVEPIRTMVLSWL